MTEKNFERMTNAEWYETADGLGQAWQREDCFQVCGKLYTKEGKHVGNGLPVLQHIKPPTPEPMLAPKKRRKVKFLGWLIKNGGLYRIQEGKEKEFFYDPEDDRPQRVPTYDVEHEVEE